MQGNDTPSSSRLSAGSLEAAPSPKVGRNSPIRGRSFVHKREHTDGPEQGEQRDWSLFETVMPEPALESLPRHTISGSTSLSSSWIGERSRTRPRAATNTSMSYFSPNAHTRASAPQFSQEPSPMLSPEINELERSQPLSPDEYAYDSDSDLSERGTHSTSESNVPSGLSKMFLWIPSVTLTTLQRDILKCSIAYFLGSLFTFVPALSGFISDIIPVQGGDGPSPAAHMVATVAVYFNPAKSLGAMQEADIYCLAAAVFSAFVALASMDTFWFFEIREGWEWLADALTFLWIGVAMTFVAWVKFWMNKPSFSPAASMASIIIFVTVVKEGGLFVLLQVSFIVLIGSVISNAVCIFLWPRSATIALQEDMIKTLSSFATLLQILTQTFLLEENLHPKHANLLLAVKDHQSSFTSLKKSRGEAKSEWWNPRIQKPSEAYDGAVDSMTRLAQHIGGLRSGLNLEFELAKRKVASSRKSVGPEDDNVQFKVAEDAFGDLVEELGPPMNALASTCVRALKKMRKTFVRLQGSKDQSPLQNFYKLSFEIKRALFAFESTSNQSLMRLYARHAAEAGEDNAAVQLEDNEPVFLIYFFIFTLQEFAQELLVLVDAMNIIHDSEVSMQGTWSTFRSLFSLGRRPNSASNEFHHPKKKRSSLRKRLSHIVPIEQRDEVDGAKLFPRIQPHAPNTMHRPPPQSLSFMGRQGQRLWSIVNRLKEPDSKYAIKTGFATAMLALPAFIDSTRPFFVQYRGEWALISFFVVMSKTIGATNLLSVHRVVGTIIGAVTAAAISTLFPETPVVLATFGFFFSIPCFYYIVARPEYATSGRFVLLAYNLTCLFCYNLRFEDQHVWPIALYRSVAVTVGVVWALFVSRWWWPSEARRELTQGLSEFCLNISWLYTALVRWYSSVARSSEDDQDDASVVADPERDALLRAHTVRRPNASILQFMQMELHLQLKLLELQGLLKQAQNEPRLKGPFPVGMYREILASLQTILDNLHSMRCVTSREEWELNIVGASINTERREMVGNVILYFSMLSAAFGLKAPLSPFLPPAEEARQRLVRAILDLDSEEKREVWGSKSKQLIYIAYALMMKGVIAELNFLGKTLQEAFGVVGYGPDDFESLFK